MEIRGLQKITLLDYPEKVACIVFTPGCNLRCPFCYNRDLVLEPKSLPEISEKYFFDFLKTREGLLDGVVVSGGEPTLQRLLPEFLTRCKSLGFLIKLDTNGARPKIIFDLLQNKLVDYIALDFKEPLGSGKIYSKEEEAGFLETLKILKGSLIAYEIRTTVVSPIHSETALIRMADVITGVPKWYLQNFLPVSCLDPSYERLVPYEQSFFDLVLPKIKEIVPSTFLRSS